MPYLELENVTYTYPGRPAPAVKGVSLAVEKGEKVALTGLNGSGKSTLARLIMGLLRPQEGRALVDGRPVQKYSLPEIGKKLGFIYQHPEQMLFNATVRNELAFGLKWQGKSRRETEAVCDFYLEEFGLTACAQKNPFELSAGEKQLVVILAVLALEPALIIMDEPAKYLDVSRKEKLSGVLQKIWRRGTGLLVISHDQEFLASFGGRTVHLVKGEVRPE